MIRGKSIRLRTVRETDLDRLYVLLTEIAHRGDFVPLHIPSEATFKRQFHETGFWSEDYGRFLIVNPAEEIVGSIWFFKSIPYFDGLEIGYTMFDPHQRRQGIMTEALSLCVDYLFQSTKSGFDHRAGHWASMRPQTISDSTPARLKPRGDLDILSHHDTEARDAKGGRCGNRHSIQAAKQQ